MNEFFFDYFRARADFVESQCLKRIEGLILMCCYLDSLAGYRFGKGNRYVHFREFILEYSGNAEIWRRISLPLLMEFFRNSNNLKCSNFIRTLGVNNQSYLMAGYNIDIDLPALENKANGKIITPFSGQMKDVISQFEYVRILWKEYRNSAVHESSTYKDEAPDVSGENEEPFYAHVNIYEDGRIARDEIRFAIPNVFILASLRRCIDDFKKYLQDGNIDLRKNLNRQ